MTVLLETIDEALKVFEPPPDLLVSEWADTYRILSPESNAEAGRWKTSRAPYQKEIMDTVNDPLVEEIVVMTSSQVGKSEILNNIIGYFIHQDPSPILVVLPKLQDAEDYSKDRLAPMFRDTPELAGIMGDARTKRSGNTILHKTFTGGNLTLAGANSPSSLASRPKRILVCDEVDRFPVSAGTEGDPINLAKKRLTAFYNAFTFLCSTPVRKGASRIEFAYERSDKRILKLPCPRCRHAQALDFKNLSWPEGEPDKARLKCEGCGEMIDHAQKFEMIKKGFWEKQNPDVKFRAGFWLNELYSPWSTWAKVARAWEESKDDPEMVKTFYNTTLGLPYEIKGDAPKWETLYQRKGPLKTNQIPKEVKFLTCGIDVQKDRFELEIVGWGEKFNSWSIDYRQIFGDTSQPETFELLTPLLSEKWDHPSGAPIGLLRTAIDSGYQTQRVYAWASKFQESKLIVVKGQDDMDELFRLPKNIGKYAKKARPLVRVWPVGTDMAKRELYSYLNLELPSTKEIELKGYPFGFCHFPENYDQEFFRMITAEVEEIKFIRGFPKYYFVKERDRNEALDCRIYARAAAATLGYDRSTPERLNDLALRSRAVAESQGGALPKPVTIKRKKSSFLG